MVTKVDIKDYEMLLDSLQMAGICVIEEDGHNVLYFNKRIKEIIPGIEAGRQLRELWTGCPLPDMHDKKEKRIVYNSSSLGIPMEITVIKKMWKGIPSLVITAASHKESDSLTYHMENVVRGMNEKESRCIINSLSSLYFATYYVDLEKGIFRVVTQRDEVGDILGEEINYNEGLTAYSYHFVHPESREEYMKKLNLERLRGILDEKHPFEAVEYRRIKKASEDMPQEDGWVRATVILSEYRNGKPVKALYVAQDVTEIKKKEELEHRMLVEACEAANHANASKSEFLSRMSHDIRTPMNAIIGMTTIAGSHLDDRERILDCLHKITVSSKHLLALINEVLDMSKIESGKIDLSEEEFNLSDLIQNVLTMIRPNIQAKNQNLELNIAKVEHEDVVGDVMRLQQVFMNILGNAVKYTPQGGTLELEIVEKESKVFGYGCYEFVFRDNGIGMSEEFVKKIFEPFSRAEDSRISKIEGTGLGMAIAMNIVRMMNGDIRVESAVNEGSQFTVSVYLKQQNTEMPDLEHLVNQPVLVADDDILACEAACAILKDIGIESEWVLSGQEAIERVSKARREGKGFFAVLLDWQMPDMDGVETTGRIRQEAGTEMPIVILSAYDWNNVETEARQAGVDGFISKPLFKSRLVYLFKKIAGTEGKKEVQEKEEHTDRNFEGKRILLAEDNELNREIAEEIIGSTGVIIDCVENGQQAVEAFKGKKEWYYDLIFMDVQMPVMNGYEATETIRKLEREDAARIPIIAMTANAFAEDMAASRRAGMNEHIAKPAGSGAVDEVHGGVDGEVEGRKVVGRRTEGRARAEGFAVGFSVGVY